MFARGKLVCLLKRPSQPEEEGKDRAAEKQRNTPSPQLHFLRGEDGTQYHSDQRCEHDGHLLACRLPTDIEALVTWRRDLREVNRDATQFHACRKTLKHTAHQH